MKLKKIFVSFFALALLVMPMFAMGSGDTVTSDRAGNPITVPEKIEKIASLAPSNTHILDALGMSSKIIALDTYSQKPAALKKDVPVFNMMKPDVEKLIKLNPDVVFITGMSNAKGADPFKPVRDAGICVICIPSSNSIQGIYDDIMLIANVTKTSGEGKAIVSDMKKKIASYKKIAKKIPAEKQKTVYFEIAAAPYAYSFGTDTFLNEIIELISAKNILADQKSWVSVSEEIVLAKNPDVILTIVNYLPKPIEEIKGRPGWNTLNAVKNNKVYRIDTNSASQPCQNIVKAIDEIAKAVYPEYFK